MYAPARTSTPPPDARSSPSRTIGGTTTAHTRRARTITTPAPLSRRALLAILALSLAGGALFYLVRPGALTDDSYAFLDWGRDLRDGHLPLLEHRTFHPLPILGGAVISLVGSHAPTVALLLAGAALVGLAVAAFRVVQLLDFPQPAPAFAAVLVLSSPLLTELAQVGYINLPFATLTLWGLAFELEDRRRAAWVMLVVAGLVRPEGWAFLVAYGVLAWWRAGRPREPRRWRAFAALSLGPMVVWLLLEWVLFGSPLYSFTNTRAPAVEATGSGSVSGLWSSLHFALATPLLVAAAAGAGVLAWLSPRRHSVVVLGMALVGAFTLAVLALSSFNVPSRHFSAFVSVLYVLAAIGLAAPAQVLARGGRSPSPSLLAAGACWVALIAGLAVSPTARNLRKNFHTVKVTHDQRGELDAVLASTRKLVDVSGARAHTVAVVGAVDESQTAWGLHVPYNVVAGSFGAQSRLLIEPARAASGLGRLSSASARAYVRPRGWHRALASDGWEVWVPRLDASARSAR